MNDPIRLLIVEDHALVRAGLNALLQEIPDFEVIGGAGDGYEALELITTHQPDIVLMDLTMPRMNGLEVLSRTAKQFPNIRVLVLSMHASEEYVWQALQSGADGYLLKDAGALELEFAIRAIARGESYLSPSVSKQVTMYIRRAGGTTNSLEQLTPRQREILQLIAEGKTTQKIAQQLKVSTKTIETHRAQLMERLDIHDVPSLVRYSIRMGLITADH